MRKSSSSVSVVREVVDDADRVASSASFLKRRDPAGDAAHDPHVGLAARDDAGPLHLDHDGRAVAQLRGVHLRDRRRRELLGADVDQVRGFLGAELLVERAPDVVERERLDAIEDLLELLDVAVGKHPDRRRDDLAELDERRAEVLAEHAQQHRTGQPVVLLAAAGEREPDAA